MDSAVPDPDRERPVACEFGVTSVGVNRGGPRR